MRKEDVIGSLEALADLLEVESDNPFQPRAFRNAARALEGLDEDLEDVIASGALEEVKGIGKSIAREIVDLATHGRSHRLEELRAKVPAGLSDLLRVPGLGPKKARALWKELGVDGLQALRAACQAGSVAALKGFGEKTQAKLLEGVAYVASVAGRFRIDAGLARAEGLLALLGSIPGVGRVQVAGSIRRRKETVKDVDILATSSNPIALSEALATAPGVSSIIAQGETKTSVRLEGGMAADLRVVPEESFPAALQYFTGSAEHNTELRGIARSLGFKLNEYGLYRGDEPLEIRQEEDIYEALGMAWIPPELREGLGEIELARTRGLPRLLERSDLRGVVHVHTTWSDGAATLEAMVEAARERGYTYMGVSDHSPAAAYAGGLSAERVRQQHQEIDRLNSKLEGFRVFKGIESDIRADGSLDYDVETLDRFDFVIASVHSGFQMPAPAMTRRIVRALQDPHTTFLGHPTGRLLLARDAYGVDMDAVLRAAAELGVCVEVNASPWRLDLDWRLGPRARELGVLTAIHPDAHSVEGLDDVEYGVGIARKAGFRKEDVVNALDAAAFEAFLGRRRPG